MVDVVRLVDAIAMAKEFECLANSGLIWEEMCAFKEAAEMVRKQPTIDPESLRPMGRWINWGKSGTPTYENYGTCSACHEDAEIHTEHRNYCPNCGAKMEG